jgi:hypothetical protein
MKMFIWFLAVFLSSPFAMAESSVVQDSEGLIPAQTVRESFPQKTEENCVDEAVGKSVRKIAPLIKMVAKKGKTQYLLVSVNLSHEGITDSCLLNYRAYLTSLTTKLKSKGYLTVDTSSDWDFSVAIIWESKNNLEKNHLKRYVFLNSILAKQNKPLVKEKDYSLAEELLSTSIFEDLENIFEIKI